jgi:hypothetical protein
MRTFLARCTMLGLLVGGFALTGDAGWILQKGQSLLNATTVPSATDLWGGPAAAETTDEPAAPWGSPAPSMAAPVNQPAAAPPPAEHSHAGLPGSPLGPVDVQVAPSLAALAEPLPAGGGESVVDLRLLRPGQRVRLWTGGGIVAFDLVDPAAGEAIQQPWTRRVRVSGAIDPHRIERGGMIVVEPRAGISGHQPPAETLGPVQAIAI